MLSYPVGMSSAHVHAVTLRAAYWAQRSAFYSKIRTAEKIADAQRSITGSFFQTSKPSSEELEQLALELGIAIRKDDPLPEDSHVGLIRRRIPELGWGACVDLMHPSFLRAYDIHEGMVFLAVVADMSAEFRALRENMERFYLNFAGAPKDGCCSPWWIAGCMMAIIEDMANNPTFYTLMTVWEESIGERMPRAHWLNMTPHCLPDQIWNGYVEAKDLGSPKLLEQVTDIVWMIHGLHAYESDVAQYADTKIYDSASLFSKKYNISSSSLLREVHEGVVTAHGGSVSEADMLLIQTAHAMAMMAKMACGIVGCVQAGVTPTLLCFQQRPDLNYLLPGGLDWLADKRSDHLSIESLTKSWRTEIVESLGCGDTWVNVALSRLSHGVVLYSKSAVDGITHEGVLFMRMMLAYGTPASSINIKELRWGAYNERVALHGPTGMIHTGIATRGGSVTANTALSINYNRRSDVEEYNEARKVYGTAKEVYTDALKLVGSVLANACEGAHVNKSVKADSSTSAGAFISSAVSRILKSRMQNMTSAVQEMLLPPPNVQTRYEEMSAQIIATNAETARQRATEVRVTRATLAIDWMLRYGLGNEKSSLPYVRSITDLIEILNSEDSLLVMQTLQLPNIEMSPGIPLWHHNVTREEQDANRRGLQRIFSTRRKLLARDEVIEAVGSLLNASDVRDVCEAAIYNLEGPLSDKPNSLRNPMIKILKYSDPDKTPRMYKDLVGTGAFNALKTLGRRFGYACYPDDIERELMDKLDSGSVSSRREPVKRINRLSIEDRLVNELTSGGVAWNTDAIMDILEVLKMEVSIAIDMIAGPVAKSVHITLARSTERDSDFDPNIALVDRRTATTGSVTFAVPGPLYLSGVGVTPKILIRHPVTKELVIGTPTDADYKSIVANPDGRRPNSVDVGLHPLSATTEVAVTSGGSNIGYVGGMDPVCVTTRMDAKKIEYGPSFGENIKGYNPFRLVDLRFGPAGFVLNDRLWGEHVSDDPKVRGDIIKSVLQVRGLNVTESELRAARPESSHPNHKTKIAFPVEHHRALEQLARALTASKLQFQRGVYVESTVLRVHKSQDEGE